MSTTVFKLYVIETTINGEKKQRLSTDYAKEEYPQEASVKVIGYGGAIVATKKAGNKRLVVAG